LPQLKFARLWRIKDEYDIFLYAGALMPRDDPDMNGVSHTVEIAAAAFYEAVAPCLAATYRFPETPRGPHARHETSAIDTLTALVKTMDFTKWFEETDGSPREVNDRLYSINPRPPLLHPATTMKAKSCRPDSGREEFRSQRVPLWNLTGVWNSAVHKIELDAKNKIYYDAKDFQNLLANHGGKMEIPSHTLQGILSQAHWNGDTFCRASAGRARIPLASMTRK
jgi:hypothetical protein